MALVPVVDSLDKVHESLKTHYTLVDGKYVLQLEGAHPSLVPKADLDAANAKVTEFRDNNIRLTQEVEPLRKLKADVGDMNIGEARTAVTELADLKKKGITKPDDVDAKVAAAVAAQMKPMQDQIAASAAREAAQAAQIAASTLKSTITGAFGKVGGRADAHDFIVNKAEQTFEVKDGRVVARQGKFSPSKPSELITVEEWMQGQAKEAAFAFQPSNGSGAPPGGAGNPEIKAGQTVLRNPTPEQLGLNSDAILKGTVVVVHDNLIPA